MPLKAVVLARGGLSSAVLAYLLGKRDPARSQRNESSLPSALRQARGLAPEGYALHLLTITEGHLPGPQAQRAARLIAALLDATYEVLDPTALTWLPALDTTSPAARLFTLAGLVAVRQEAEVIAAALHTSEPAFLARFNQIAERVGKVTDLPRLQLLTPLAGSNLATLIGLGVQLGIPLEATWSCSASFSLQCGRCAACVVRQASFRQAGVQDRTRYHAPAGAEVKGR